MLSRHINWLFEYLGCRRRYLSQPLEAASPTSKRFHSIPRPLFMGLMALSIYLSPAGSAQASMMDNPHHFLQACGNCHESGAQTDKSQKITVGPLHRDINQTCNQTGCHDLNSSLNHPIGVNAGGHVPAEMPLSSKGQITCLTCHDELNRSNSKNIPAFLRRAPGQDLCASCHLASGATSKKRSHWQFTTKAHLGTKKAQAYSNNYTAAINDIDRESLSCLSCHDDVSAVIAGDNESTSARMQRRRYMSDHPIGMTYATKANSNREFKMPSKVDARIRLFNGRMGCGSCHNLYDSGKKNLSLPFTRGELCRQCHIK